MKSLEVDYTKKRSANTTDEPAVSAEVERMPGFIGDFFSELDEDHKPEKPTGYTHKPGKFDAPYLQQAKEQLDEYFRKTPISESKRMRAYHIAECKLGGVSRYVTDEWITMMHMEHMRDLFRPPTNESLPVTLPTRQKHTRKRPANLFETMQFDSMIVSSNASKIVATLVYFTLMVYFF